MMIHILLGVITHTILLLVVVTSLCFTYYDVIVVCFHLFFLSPTVHETIYLHVKLHGASWTCKMNRGQVPCTAPFNGPLEMIFESPKTAFREIEHVGPFVMSHQAPL